MSATAAGQVVRTVLLGTAAVLGAIVVTATPAAAHNVGGGELPAPPWLLSYVGAFAVAATAVALRATWPAPRLLGFTSDVADDAGEVGAPGFAAVHGADRRPIRLHPGHAVGVALLALALIAAVVGPDSGAANVAPVAVLVVWWVGLPIACLLAGDVMRVINPFIGIVGVLQPSDERTERRAPTWTGAAFLAAFAWFFIAYHRPGSPRALAVFLVAYALAAVLGGLVWGRRWLATGEGFGALSAAVALLSPWRRHTSPPPGLTPLMIVWLGSTAFDAFTSTPFWVDVVGASQGWNRTFLHTVGLSWLIAVVAGIYLGVLRLAAARTGDDLPEPIAERLGAALVPLALGWFLAHDLTLLLFEGQNFIALLSDPIGEGWDLFGTLNHTIDYGVVQSTWVRWAQLALLTAGHVATVVIGHDVALRLVRRRAAMAITWALAAAAVVSIVAAALMVLG